MPNSRDHADIGAQIDLVSAVQALRAQITEAAATDPGSDVRFQIGPIELEFTVALTRDRSVKGGVKAWVVSADADARRSTAQTHRVKFNLTPISASTGESPEISNTDSGHRLVR
ncbi:trypco2 family protein [Streptomyces sp. RGM 3693]|uniref:trypco2 family protein n=1 Tax=Streptomyces sp. RGM 3693 TaxID=3413284 RepID=UPI003D26DCF1